jgi:predicted nucleic acid-binding protein
LTLVVDASVAAKWFFEEPGHSEARGLLDRNEAIIAPSLVLLELGNTAWKRYRRGEITPAGALEVVHLAARVFTELFDIEALAPQAAELAVEFNHPIYDCLYLALARRERLALLTADRKLAAVTARAGVDAHLFG